LYQDVALQAGPGSWKPDELGLPKATALALVLVAVIVTFCLYASGVLPAKPPPQAIQVTVAQLVTLPKPTPPPPPKVVPPPKPLPAVIPKPPPVPSKIVVATKPPPPVHHIYKPIPHPVAPHPPTPTPPLKQPPAPPVQNTSGVPIYGSQMHAILQANQDVPQALKQLGVSGTCYVEITVAPDGHPISAKIYKSSGVPLIDQTALDHAMSASYGAFNANMPSGDLSFIVPIEIDAEDSDD
jgi:protein TonB